MIGAFSYLILHSARNQVVGRLKRLRSPRYALALLLGLGYFAFVFSANRSPRADRMGALSFAGGQIAVLLPVAILVYVAYTWMSGSDRGALTFTNAEVSMLFSAPVSRRALIVYKLARSQVSVFVSSILWVILFSRGHDAPIRALSYWVFLSTLNLHRLGAALVHAASAEHGVRGLRRSWLTLSVFGAAFAAVVVVFFNARGQLASAEDMTDLFRIVTARFTVVPLSWVLFPFRVAVAPIVASDTAVWTRAIGPALALLALHVAWVLRSDSAFEEAAADASAAHARRLAAFRQRRSFQEIPAIRATRRTLPLAAAGAPSASIVWKNLMWLLRSGQLRVLLGLPAVGMVAAIVLSRRNDQAAFVITGMWMIFGLMMFLFGPLMMRNDLRGDLRRLPMVKTFPLSGQQIIFAEVASSAIPSAVFQFLLFAVASIPVFMNAPSSRGVLITSGLLAAAPVLLLGLNLANSSIHNGLALLFPGWIRLGEANPGGVEAVGQMMLTSILTLVMLALLLLFPALGAGAAYFVLRRHLLGVIVVGGTMAGIALCLESFLISEILGGTLERTEPMSVG